MDPRHFGNLDQHPHQIKIQDPDLHQSGKLDPEPDPHQFPGDKPKVNGI
jgi:hypothetical protein